MTDTIHTAFAMSTKGGKHYRARAYVERSTPCGPVQHTRTIALDDTPEAAIAACVADIERRCETRGMPIVNHGRKSAVMVDNFQFD